jgi:hypothetical protein
MVWQDNCSSIFRELFAKKNIFGELDPQKDYLWHWIPSKGKSGGMLSGIKLERFSLENFESGEFVIVANVLDKKNLTKPSLANVYGPAQDEFRLVCV